MSKKNILVVDDEKDLCEILTFNLKHHGFDVDSANSAEEAIALLKNSTYRLILLDVMMGGMSGFKMTEHLRESNDNTPVIFLTARDTENDLLTGFSVGGDDYISKPFSIKEVVARVEAVLKRTESKESPERENIQIEQLSIDVETKRIFIDGKAIDLTKTEFEILYHLVVNAGRIYSRENILDVVWPDDAYVLERTVDVHLARLRKKLGEYGQRIKNRPGYGYFFE
ncbi:MAG: response regulator transcription factor [Prevotellaceae bacterium]|jgi:DNA-binding response OmpR family regulator|nr:response regulator transcription factor [Prevotellaceae bacterium]